MVQATPAAVPPIPDPDRIVLTYGCVDPEDPTNHDCVTRRRIAERLAHVLGLPFGGEYDSGRRYAVRPYFVPSDTVIGCDVARELGIRDETDLFGAVVPYAFAATKTITHDAVEHARFVPIGWSPAFADAVRDAVLAGYAAFTAEDVRTASRRLLERGPARIKLAQGIGGVGQFVVRDLSEVEGVLETLSDAELRAHGVVVEENLHDVTTRSVGQVRVGGLVLTYCGTQCLTRNNRGSEVYGGSSLVVVRGDFDTLLALPQRPEVRLAIAHAQRYDAAAQVHFAGMFASRRNYDVAHGVDASGSKRAGVLEQSWRIGGASSAEMAALEAFVADPALRVVRASSVERFGETGPPPAHAIVYYCDDDRRAGKLTKYAFTEPYADA